MPAATSYVKFQSASRHIMSNNSHTTYRVKETKKCLKLLFLCLSSSKRKTPPCLMTPSLAETKKCLKFFQYVSSKRNILLYSMTPCLALTKFLPKLKEILSNNLTLKAIKTYKTNKKKKKKRATLCWLISHYSGLNTVSGKRTGENHSEVGCSLGWEMTAEKGL